MTDQRKIGPGAPVSDPPARADFFNRMIGALSETIEDVVGVEDAESFIGVGGSFRVEKIDGDCIIFSNGHCPFGKEVVGRTSLCQMTTNVFGRVAANATGFARVHVAESLARGDARCLVKVRLSKPVDDIDDGQDFYG